MHPWHASVSLVAIMLLATSNGERLAMEKRPEPDSSEGLSQLEREGERGGEGRELGGRGKEEGREEASLPLNLHLTLAVKN